MMALHAAERVLVLETATALIVAVLVRVIAPIDGAQALTLVLALALTLVRMIVLVATTAVARALLLATTITFRPKFRVMSFPRREVASKTTDGIRVNVETTKLSL